MKFTLFDKFLLVLVLLVIIAFAAVCFGMALSLISEEMLVFAIGVMTNGMIENKLILAGIGLVLLILALRLFVAMGSRKAAAPKAPTSALVAAGDNGATYITLAAVDSMTQRHCRANPKVRECESTVTALTGGIAIGLKLAVTADAVIPELTGELQNSLKEYLESMCGLKVVNIDMLVIPSAQTAKMPAVM